MAEKIQIRSSFPEVPYLKSEIINKFGNIIVKTADRLEFKINSLILVSVSQLFKNFLKNIDDDIQEVVILSEFDSSDLKIFREFIMEGYLPKNAKSSKIEKIFQSFGIDLNRIINGNNFFSHSNNENIFDVEDIMKKIEEEDLLEVTPEINNTIFNQKNLTVELLDQVKKENSYCNQCDIQFCNQYSLENHISSIHPYLEFDQDNVEEIDVFDELFKADYEKILSKTQNSFGEIIDNVEIDNTDKFRKNSQNYDFWEPDNQIQGKENENSVNIRKRKEKKLGEEFETFMNFDDEIFENQSKIQIKDDDQPYKPDEEDENSMNHEMVETKSNTSNSQITGLRNDRKRLIGYKELSKFKEELKNNFDVKIPPPDFTLEDFKNFVFPKPLEELEVIPSILAEYKCVIPSPGNPQCGVCGVFGLNTYPNIKYHHVKHHAIHYACPIDDCG